jgi:hypothetical protein
MSSLLDHGVVALALLASVIYAFSSLGPKAWRSRAWIRLAQLAKRLHLRGVARRLEAAAAKSSPGCGGCGSCEGESSKGPAAVGAKGAVPEVRVPLERIGKRRA